MGKIRLENEFTVFFPTKTWKVNTVRDYGNPEEFYLEVAHGSSHHVNLVQHNRSGAVSPCVSLDKSGAILLRMLLTKFIDRNDRYE